MSGGTTAETRLDACGCCEGLERLTPVRVENAPGLSALAYRVGTHARFKASLQAELSRQAALASLTTRDDDDASLALLDACAAMLDVLTFYQERIANEGYLRTATERRSLLELGRAIGYQLSPGVAASAYLAFTLEDAPGAPRTATVDVGTKVQSVPGPGEQPQTFETVESIEPRTEWNEIRPRRTKPHELTTSMSYVWVEGVSVNLKAGDRLLVAGSPGGSSFTRVRRVLHAEADPVANRTRVVLDPGSVIVPATQSLAESGVWALRIKSAPFGHNAPLKAQVTPSSGEITYSEWPLNEGNNKLLSLDGQFDGIRDGSFVVIGRPTASGYEYIVDQAVSVDVTTRADYGISARVTRLTTGQVWVPSGATDLSKLRRMVVFAQAEKLPLVEQPLSITKGIAPISGSVVELEGLHPDLRAGRPVAVSGEVVSSGEVAGEVAEIKQVSHSGGRTSLAFVAPLADSYARETVTLNANVAAATHGETRREVLGSGDASRPFQSFTLKGTPLTYVQAATPSGGLSTLEVRVADVLWHEVPSLYDRGPKERIYVTRRGDDGKVTVQFGDGKTGARLPSGTENVVASYRVGVGTGGNVDAGQLTTLLSRPLGVRAANNPRPAEGGADPESRDRARVNAPLTVRTLDRVVSLLDYEDFARSFNGVGKAQAMWLWNGNARVVHLTVAGDAGETLGSSSTVLSNLLKALQTYRDPLVQVQVDTYEPVSFQLEARLRISADHEAERVFAAVHDALRDAFSFEARGFGQPVTRSEVLALIQRVNGVVAVDLDALFSDPAAADLNPVLLRAETARWNGSAKLIEKAQLLTLSALESAALLSEMPA